MTTALYCLPRACACSAPRLIRVFPVPHSAMTAAVRAASHRCTMPQIATHCAGYGFRRRPSISGAIGSPGR